MNEYLVDKLKQGRMRKGLKQSDVAKMIGVKGNTLSNYENGVSEPDIDTFCALCDIYDLDPADVLGEAYGLAVQGSDLDIKPSEIELIKKYRFIAENSPSGATTVDYILNHEHALAEEIKNHLDSIAQKAEMIVELESDKTKQNSKLRYIQYYQRLASAGTGQIVFDSVPTDIIEIPDAPGYKNASFAIGVNGDSMEPLYHDSDILLVEKVDSVDVGDIGIFMVDGESYVKKLGPNNELISLNRKYANIPLTVNSRCMGRVVDKLEAHSSKLTPQEIYDLLSEEDRAILENSDTITEESNDSRHAI